MADKAILATVTGEFFQPVRLYYRIFDDKGLLQALNKLSPEPSPDRRKGALVS